MEKLQKYIYGFTVSENFLEQRPQTSGSNKKRFFANTPIHHNKIGDTKMNNTTSLRPRTIKLLSRVIKPFVEEGIIMVSEEQEILKNLQHLATKNTLVPTVMPKLITQKESAEILGLSHSNFKKLEKEGALPFARRMVGSAVRYRNTDIIAYIMAGDGGSVA